MHKEEGGNMIRRTALFLISLILSGSVLLSSCAASQQHNSSETAGPSSSAPSTSGDPAQTGAVTLPVTPAPQETTKGTSAPTAGTAPWDATHPTPTEAPPPPTTEAPTQPAETTAAVTSPPPTETAAPTTEAPTTAAPTTQATTSAGGQYDTASYSWYNIRNNTHTLPGIPGNAGPWLSAYNGIWHGDTSRKVFYLTFDCGYDTGYANQIMDVLAGQGIKATFFVTKIYITNNPDIVRRMVNDGYVVANHTVTHGNLAEMSDDSIRQELQGVEEAFTNATGAEISRMIRPPSGFYSERSLYICSQLGYKTVFWSIAYKDYDVNNQPTYEEAMSIVRDNYHDGAVMLLHVASQTDANALNDMINFLKDQGYTFETL